MRVEERDGGDSGDEEVERGRIEVKLKIKSSS